MSQRVDYDSIAESYPNRYERSDYSGADVYGTVRTAAARACRDDERPSEDSKYYRSLTLANRRSSVP